MNNFRKHCAFYLITFTPWRSPPPPLETTKLWSLFSLCEVPLFSFWGALFSFWRPFSPYGGLSLCGEIVMLIPNCKNFYGAHTLDAKVVANIAPLGNLREIAILARHPIC